MTGVISYKYRFTQNCLAIKDETLRAYALQCIPAIPEQFWTVPSSSSGKHHPPDERGMHGRVIHTFRALKIGLLLCDQIEFNEIDTDIVRFAILYHDITEAGIDIQLLHSDLDHPETCVKLLAQTITFHDPNWNYGPFYEVLNCIRCHTGRWGKIQPDSTIESIVHTADNISSKLHLIVPEWIK